MRSILVVVFFALITGKTNAQQTTECVWNIPTAITISETNQADYWVPITCSCEVKKVKIKVYNRWGVVQYETEQLQHEWKGDKTDSGVYMFVIDGIYANGEKFTKNASVNFLR